MAHVDDVGIPLDRDEELARQIVRKDATRSVDRAKDLLFRTRLAALSPKPPVSVALGASVAEACARMREAKIGCVLVLDGPALVGIFTERDVLYKVTSDPRDPADIRIDEMMTRNPTTLRAGHRLAHALNKMSVDGCRHIPIVGDDGRPTGVVSVRRIVDFLVEHFASDLMTLPPDPDQHLAMDRAEGG